MQLVTHYLSRILIRDQAQVHETIPFKPYVGNIRHPDLAISIYLHLLDQIRVTSKEVGIVSSTRCSPSALAHFQSIAIHDLE